MAIYHKLLKNYSVYRHFSTTNFLASATPVELAYNSYDNVKGDTSASPLIIMHGLFGSKFNWNSLCKALSSKVNPPRKIISVDARNHGDSPHTIEHTYEHMAEDLVDLLRKMNIEKASVLGHSMGGRAMMYFALKYPHIIDKAIIVDISPVSGIGTSMTNITLFLKSMKLIQIPATETIHKARKTADFQLSKIIPEKSLRDFLITNLAKTGDGSFKWRINLESLEENFHTNISKFPDVQNLKYHGPTLFIAGGKSDYVKKSDFPHIQKLFPNAELTYIDGAGHWVHSEKPNEFLQLVLDFLNKNN